MKRENQIGYLKFFIGLFFGVLLSCIIVLIMKSYGYITIDKQGSDNLGIKAVNYMYTFDGLNNLAYNDKQLKKITTKKAYQAMTVTDADKALNTYLKLKAKDGSFKCKVDIIDAFQGENHGYVVYTLDTAALTYGRRFIFFYKIDKEGKIKNPIEYEGITFPNYVK